MKHKFTKRSISIKATQPRSYQTQVKRLATPVDHVRPVSPANTEPIEEPLPPDSFLPCLKPDIIAKSQKLLKRDLLRSSNQRPTFLGPQTLQPILVHQTSQPIHSVASSTSSSSSSSVDNRYGLRRRSLSLTSRAFHSTTDKIGPWPDISTNIICSNQTNLLRPLKKLRTIKHNRISSPKSSISSNDNANQFKFHPSKRDYMEIYRKSKGYVLDLPSKKQDTSLSLSSSANLIDFDDDDQLSAVGTCRSGARSSTVLERTYESTTNLSAIGESNVKQVTESSSHNATNHSCSHNSTRLPMIATSINQINIPGFVPIQSNLQFRMHRRMRNYFTKALPPILNPPVQYLNSIDPVEKFYDHHKKHRSNNHSKIYLINGRPKKR